MATSEILKRVKAGQHAVWPRGGDAYSATVWIRLIPIRSRRTGQVARIGVHSIKRDAPEGAVEPGG